MTRGSDRLEHLFSRHIDGECTPEECRLLEALLRDDPEARQLYEDYRQLDEQFGTALQQAWAAPVRARRPRPLWVRIGRNALVAVAASVAALLWLQPTRPSTPTPRGKHPVQAAASTGWFAPAPQHPDVVEPVPGVYERPQLRVGGTQRDWIVVPGDEPRQFMVIEVNRVRTHVIVVHQDF